jgi:hypothetical protein
VTTVSGITVCACCAAAGETHNATPTRPRKNIRRPDRSEAERRGLSSTIGHKSSIKGLSAAPRVARLRSRRREWSIERPICAQCWRDGKGRREGIDTTDSRHNIRHRELRPDVSSARAEDLVRLFHRDTPPDAFARDRGSWQVSWLTGPRSRPPSRNVQRSSGVTVERSPLTVAGAAAAFTAFPFDPLREPRGLSGSGRASRQAAR